MNKSLEDLSDIHFTVRQPEDATYLWVISYSDFMTILMIFFLMLFAYRVWSKEASWEAERVRLQELAREAQTGLVQRLSRMTSIDVKAQRINIHLPDALLFEPGHADLKDSAKNLLHEMSPELAHFKGDILVEGHTDNQPLGQHARYATNWELSVARAFSVIHYLTSHGVDPEHISARGYGPYRPRVSNDTPTHRAENRRIEIVLLTREKKETQH
jgi:chemotaxis protein MotB